MRSFLLILTTLVVLGGGFAVYAWLQPTTAAQRPGRALSGPSRLQRMAATTQSLGGVGSGDNPWIKRYVDGELASQFRGERYDPQADGFHVERPQAEFFSADGKQRIRVEGASGDVVTPAPPPSRERNALQSAGGGGEFAPPSRGNLRDVVVSVFEPADSDEAVLVARMNNAAFDIDKFRIATESYTDAAGARVEADQVPVIVRGRDYDFDGRGLVIRWNERDRKLELLQIEHGQSLTIKNPSALSRPDLVPTTRVAAPAEGGPLMLASADRFAPPAMLAAADSFAPSLVLAAAQQPRPARRRPAQPPPPAPPAPSSRPRVVRDLSPVVYRATFERDVRIFEGEKQIVSMEQMQIDLLQEPQRDETTQPTSQPAPKSSRRARRPPRADAATPEPPSTPSPKSSASEPPAARSSPASSPTTLKGPIVVKWAGKLRVVPLEAKAAPAELAAGKALVRMLGEPVTLNRDGTNVECGSASYNSADGSATLESSRAVPAVTLTDARGMRVVTPRIQYADVPGQGRVATLTGASTAEIPVDEGDAGVTGNLTTPPASSKPHTIAKASWAKSCRLYLDEDASGRVAIQRAELEQEVTVTHPRLDLRSRGLALVFDPNPPKLATAKPAGGEAASVGLREIIASGGVRARMSDGANEHAIDASNLLVQAARDADGRAYPKLIRADGEVVTSQNGNELRAGHLIAELAPATRPAAAATQGVANATPSVVTAAPPATTQPAQQPFGMGGDMRLVSMLATDNVRLSTPDKTRITAGKLEASSTAGGQMQYRLIGEPLATVSDGRTTLTGPAIRFAPDQNLAEIDGAGTLRGASPDDPKQTIDIAWAGSARVDGNTDLIDVDRGVTMTSVQADGTVNGATADHLRAKLALRPTTHPAHAAGESAAAAALAAAAAATRPAKPGQPQVTLMAGKEIAAATLTGKVEVKSELPGPNNTVARGLNLYSTILTYDRATGRLEVPAAGQMLYQDHRPAGAEASEGPTVGSGRGRTAFEWKNWLVYDPGVQAASLNGDVRVVHWPDANGGQPFNLNAMTLTAYLEPDPAAAGAKAGAAPALPAAAPLAAAAPATSPVDAATKLRLRQVTAAGDVSVTSQRLNFTSANLAYHPLEQVLTATGGPAGPVTVVDNQTGSQTAADELRWNTKTDQFRIRNLSGKVR